MKFARVFFADFTAGAKLLFPLVVLIFSAAPALAQPPDFPSRIKNLPQFEVSHLGSEFEVSIKKADFKSRRDAKVTGVIKNISAQTYSLAEIRIRINLDRDPIDDLPGYLSVFSFTQNDSRNANRRIKPNEELKFEIDLTSRKWDSMLSSVLGGAYDFDQLRTGDYRLSISCFYTKNGNWLETIDSNPIVLRFVDQPAK